MNPAIKSIVFRKSRNVFNKDKRTDGFRLNYTNGALIEASGITVSDYMPVIPETNYYRNKKYVVNTDNYCFFNSDKVFVSGVGADPAYINLISIPASVAFIRTALAIADIDTYQLTQGSAEITYEQCF